MSENEKFQFIDLESDSLIAFMQDRKLWVDLKDHIDPTFYNDKNVSKIFQLMLLYFNKYKDFPNKNQIITLLNKKNINDKDINKLVNTVYTKGELSLSDITFIRDEMNEFIKINKMERAILQSVDLIEKKQYTKVHDIVTDAVHWNPDVKLGTNYSNAEERYAKLYELMNNIIESPWEKLNFFLGGGFFRKELYLFAAASSVGKSIALDQVALHCWDKLGLDVVMITFEMSEERKGQRMDACKFGIPVTNVFNEKKHIINIFEKEDKKNKLFIKEMPQTATTADIEQYLYQLELYEGIKPHILVVDYMDIMSPRRNKTGKDYDDQGTVGADLRDFAKEYNIPVISACLGLNTIVKEKYKGDIKIKDINIGDFILSKNGIFNKVLNKQINKNTDIYEITTKSGKKIICSKNHKFPTTNGEKSLNSGLNIGEKLFIYKKSQ